MEISQEILHQGIIQPLNIRYQRINLRDRSRTILVLLQNFTTPIFHSRYLDVYYFKSYLKKKQGRDNRMHRGEELTMIQLFDYREPLYRDEFHPIPSRKSKRHTGNYNSALKQKEGEGKRLSRKSPR